MGEEVYDALVRREPAELPEPTDAGWDDEHVDTLMREIQGNILKSHARPLVRMVFFRFRRSADRTARGRVLGELARKYVTSARAQHLAVLQHRVTGETGPLFGQLALSEDGYGVLGLEPRHRFPSATANAFLAGMSRSRLVPGAFEDPHPSRWDPFFQEQSEGRRVHGVFVLADARGEEHEKRLANAVKDLRDALQPLADVHVEAGAALEDEKEHFGYRDGISQPRFFAQDTVKAGGVGQHHDDRAALSMVLARDPYADHPAGFGSYLVYRKLEQDVAGFNAWVTKTAEDTMDMSPDLFGAFVVGRFKDGTPVLESDHPTGSENNDFDFDLRSNDRMRCPLHSHIRKSNPRDATTFLGVSIDSEASVHRRRIARRGIPYGAPPDPSAPAPTKGVGLQFMCFQSDIRQQFEVIQRRWVDFELFPTLGVGDDALIGQAGNVRQDWPTSWGGTGTRGFQPPQFVTLKGGDYFFAPSMSFIRALGHD